MTYEELGVDPNKLKRDYLKNPLKHLARPSGGLCYEKPYIEDLLYLYQKCYLSTYFIAKLLNISEISLIHWFKEFKINRRNKELTNQIKIKTNLLKFGAKNYSSTIDCKEKRTKTFMKRYGIKSPFESEQFRKKGKETCLKKYGVLYPQSLDYIKQKQKNTDLYNHNGKFHTQTKEYIDKVKQTKLKRYKDENYRNITKIKQTLLERYGVENPAHIPGIGKIISRKSYETKKRNNSLNTSKPEIQIKQHLENIFKLVKYQYKSEEYPFICDFYIPELNLYIEYQGIWTHGSKPFENTKEDLIKLKLWKEKAKTSKFYKQAIDVWTRRDPLKREIARKNKLNLIEFFTMSEFEEWFKQF